jgi:Domain of unknown function (DUF4440)
LLGVRILQTRPAGAAEGNLREAMPAAGGLASPGAFLRGRQAGRTKRPAATDETEDTMATAAQAEQEYEANEEFQEFTKFKKEFEQASRDKNRAAIERMMHPDFSMVTPQGDVVSRDGVIAGIVSSGSTFMPHYERQERTISFGAARGIVREIADVHIGGEIPGRGAVTGEYTHSAIFVRGEHGWQFFGNTLTRKNKAA